MTSCILSLTSGVDYPSLRDLDTLKARVAEPQLARFTSRQLVVRLEHAHVLVIAERDRQVVIRQALVAETVDPATRSVWGASLTV